MPLPLHALLGHDVGAFIVQAASLMAAFKLMATSKSCQAALRAHVRQHLAKHCDDPQNSIVSWVVADLLQLRRMQSWKNACLPPWDALLRAGKSYNELEWTLLKDHVASALQQLFKTLGSAVFAAPLLCDCSPGDVLELGRALHCLSERTGNVVAEKVNLQTCVRERPEYRDDRLQLGAAIRDWAQPRLADPSGFGSCLTTRDETASIAVFGDEHALCVSLRASLLAACGGHTGADGFGNSLLDAVDAARARPALCVSGAGLSARQQAVAYHLRRHVLCAAMNVVQRRVERDWLAFSDDENSAAAEVEAAEAEAEAEATGVLFEEAPLATFLGLRYHPSVPPERRSALQFQLRLARAFLRGPNRSRARASLFDVFLTLMRMERAEAEAQRSGSEIEAHLDSARMRHVSTAGQQLLARPLVPLRVLASVQGAVGGGAVAAHICDGRCAAPGPLSKALLAELRHLYAHCAGSGVSAWPGARLEEDCKDYGPGSNLLEWGANVEGPEGTPWEGRCVVCRLRFCPTLCGGTFPAAPPKLFVRPPFPHHPNIDAKTGAVCMDLLQHNWSCAGGVRAILVSFRSLLAGPNTSDAASMPANLEAAKDFLTRPDVYHAKNVALASGMPHSRN